MGMRSQRVYSVVAGLGWVAAAVWVHSSAHAEVIQTLVVGQEYTVTVERISHPVVSLGADGGYWGSTDGGYAGSNARGGYTPMVNVPDYQPQQRDPEDRDTFDKAKVIIDEVIELGAKAWNFIVDNKPVVDLATQTASAVPKGATHWMDLEGWQTPRTELFRLRFKNFFGVTVVDLSYRVIFGWGGGLDGRGRFLSDVTVLPTTLSTSWGYKVNASTSVVGSVNTGTKLDPVAAMQLQINLSIKTPVKQLDIATRYFVRGDGVLVDLSNGTEYPVPLARP